MTKVEMSGIDLRAIKAAAKSRFGRQPGVVGFGIGAEGLRIYVVDATVADGLPFEFLGVPVEIVVTGEVEATQP